MLDDKDYKKLKPSYILCKEPDKKVFCMYRNKTGDAYIAAPEYIALSDSIEETIATYGKDAIISRIAFEKKEEPVSDWDEALSALGVRKKAHGMCKAFFLNGYATIPDIRKLIQKNCIIEIMPGEVLMIKTADDTWKISKFAVTYNLEHNNYKKHADGSREIMKPVRYHLQRTGYRLPDLIDEIVSHRYTNQPISLSKEASAAKPTIKEPLKDAGPAGCPGDDCIYIKADGFIRLYLKVKESIAKIADKKS